MIQLAPHESEHILSTIIETHAVPALHAHPRQASLSAPAFPRSVCLIADDLTGACDAAAAFLPWNSVRVWLGPIANDHCGEDVQAVNTNSRNLTPEAAAVAVAQSASQLSPGSLPYKKVDSAGRGPIAAELLAAHRALATDIILFAPSFPSHRRIVRDGVLCIYPTTGPGTHLPLHTLFPAAHLASIAVVNHPSSLSNAIERGKQVAICDAETNEDLEALVRTALTLPQRILYAGSAGLASALAACLHHNHPPTTAPSPSVTSALTIIGTNHLVTQLQLKHLLRSLPDTDLLTIRCEPRDGDQILAHFHSVNPQALVLTGGDTALLALRALGTHSILLRGQFQPGIPWGVLQGGLAHGRIVVTKSGGFGSAETLSQLLLTLSGHS